MDLNDAHSMRDVIIDIKPDYFINFAAQSFVAGSWDYPIQTWDTDADAVLHILESIRRFAPNCRFYNAGSSEEFGDVLYSTPVLKYLSKCHNDVLDVETNYPEVFENNPYVGNALYMFDRLQKIQKCNIKMELLLNPHLYQISQLQNLQVWQLVPSIK